MVDILKYFVIFYFLLNLVITFIAIRYDSPKDAIRQYGVLVMLKAVAQLLIGGIVFAILQLIDEL